MKLGEMFKLLESDLKVFYASDKTCVVGAKTFCLDAHGISPAYGLPEDLQRELRFFVSEVNERMWYRPIYQGATCHRHPLHQSNGGVPINYRRALCQRINEVLAKIRYEVRCTRGDKPDFGPLARALRLTWLRKRRSPHHGADNLVRRPIVCPRCKHSWLGAFKDFEQDHIVECPACSWCGLLSVKFPR